ncbi:hypothetical protein [Novosphingobium kaempferiae]|uniref:hypothetical protein n=1 Tax=Novosphingobium kaempferiae TaxID=2896849 RepID=UPI001E30437E|nr:hypothetical protein [Novosphingobium kaempferiae]
MPPASKIEASKIQFYRRDSREQDCHSLLWIVGLDAVLWVAIGLGVWAFTR